MPKLAPKQLHIAKHQNSDIETIHRSEITSSDGHTGMQKKKKLINQHKLGKQWCICLQHFKCNAMESP